MSTDASANIKRWDDGYLFPTAHAGAGAAAYSSTDSSSGLTTKTEVATARAEATAGSYTGVDANAHILTYGHEHGEFKLGLGLDTGAGIRDGTLEVNVLGFGLKLGNNIGFNIAGTQATYKNFGRDTLSSIRGWFS
ncbi:hypothetical protein DL93DRAFT_2153290 [Clavulina sp. PMI_390]|nr:hypothetical protein DL93DRAFT_2153290 [Clavulina sp. PMI_390]